MMTTTTINQIDEIFGKLIDEIKPTKERPLVFGTGNKCYKNDGFHLYISDTFTGPWKKLSKDERKKLLKSFGIKK